MPPRRSQPSSSQGLIITLVICFLFIIGLGVATWFGFSEQGKKEEAKKKAEDDANTFKAERDWYKYQAWQYCKDLGQDQDIDSTELNLMKGKFADGSLAKNQKDGSAVKNAMDKVEEAKKGGWDGSGTKPAVSYKDLLADARTEYKELQNKRDQADKEKQLAADELEKKKGELEDARKQFDTALEKVKDQAKVDLTEDRKKIDELRNEIGRLGAERESKVKEIDEARQKLVKDLHKRDQKIKELYTQLAQKNEELASIKLKASEAPAAMRSDWKIVQMDTRGTMPYINLGSADRVRPQLTFSIHGVNVDGRPTAASKGTLEVVRVLGDHWSQARITSVKDPNRDPILKGDVLYNPFWNPLLKKHVAVAGLIDLSTGTGSRDPERGIQDFIRQLERQGVIVDAYLDPKDYSIRGPGIGVQTDSLILGEGLEFYGDARDKNIELAKKWDKGISDMKKQAAENGVHVIGLRKYLEDIGYRMPPSLAEPTGVSPLYKPRPDQLPPPPVEKQPEEKDKPKEKAGPEGK
jgi:hypothetical protein